MTAQLTEQLPARFIDTMAGAASSVSVVTTIDAGVPYGTTVSAFCSLSLTPPMILVSLDNNSRLLRHIPQQRTVRAEPARQRAERSGPALRVQGG